MYKKYIKYKNKYIAMKTQLKQNGGNIPFGELFNNIYIVHGNNIPNMIPLFINYDKSHIFIKIYDDQLEKYNETYQYGGGSYNPLNKKNTKFLSTDRGSKENIEKLLKNKDNYIYGYYHTNWYNLVYPHKGYEGTNWENSNYALVTPLSSQKGRIIRLHPQDTMIYDYLTYDDRSFFVCDMFYMEELKKNNKNFVSIDHDINDTVTLEGVIGKLQIYSYWDIGVRTCIDIIYQHKKINVVKSYPALFGEYIDYYKYINNENLIKYYKYDISQSNFSKYITNNNKCLTKMFPEKIDKNIIWDKFPNKIKLIRDIHIDHHKSNHYFINYMNNLSSLAPFFSDNIEKLYDYLKNINNDYLQTIMEYNKLFELVVYIENDDDVENHINDTIKNNKNEYKYITSYSDYYDIGKNKINSWQIGNNDLINVLYQLYNDPHKYYHKLTYDNYVINFITQIGGFLDNMVYQNGVFEYNLKWYIEQVINNYIYDRLEKLRLQGKIDIHNMYYKKETQLDFFYGNLDGDPWLVKYDNTYFHFITEYNELFCKYPMFMSGMHGMCNYLNYKSADIIQDIFTYECKALIDDFDRVAEYNYIKYNKSIVLDKNEGYKCIGELSNDFNGNNIYNPFDDENDDIESKYINRIKYYGFWYFQTIFCDIKELELNNSLIKNLIVCFRYYCKIIYVLYTKKKIIENINNLEPTIFYDEIRTIISENYDSFDIIYHKVKNILLSYIPENKQNIFTEYLDFPI